MTAPPAYARLEPRPAGEWLSDARSYCRELNLMLVAHALLAVLPFWLFTFSIFIRSMGKLIGSILFGLPFLGTFGLLAWTISRVIVIFLRADSRLRALGYAPGSAHHVLRILDTCEEGEVPVKAPPPRDELEVTPAWETTGPDRVRLARTLLAVGFPRLRRPWRPRRRAA